jgi:hypothetical protein
VTYGSPVRRRLRTVRRLASASTRSELWGSGLIVPAFWWDGHPNFGDDLTPWLLPHYGFVPVHRAPKEAQLAGVGSIIEFLPDSYDGAVWGSGLIDARPRALPAATFLAARGHHTRELVGGSDAIAVGDPGILVERHVKRPKVRWKLGVVPHGHHRSHEGIASFVSRGADQLHVVNVHQRAHTAVREIASCAVVLTTSLHGLVTADSFGIPAVWTLLEPPLEGGDFKFRDYESVVTPGQTRFIAFDDAMTIDQICRVARKVDADTVRHVGDGLERALASLPEVIPHLARFPSGVSRVLRARRPSARVE